MVKHCTKIQPLQEIDHLSAVNNNFGGLGTRRNNVVFDEFFMAAENSILFSPVFLWLTKIALPSWFFL
jgi:hypothetical protein